MFYKYIYKQIFVFCGLISEDKDVVGEFICNHTVVHEADGTVFKVEGAVFLSTDLLTVLYSTCLHLPIRIKMAEAAM